MVGLVLACERTAVWGPMAAPGPTVTAVVVQKGSGSTWDEQVPSSSSSPEVSL